MATEFTLPDLGENITSGDVVSVLVKAGDVVEPGQSVLEVETDKAVLQCSESQPHNSDSDAPHPHSDQLPASRCC